MVGFLGRIGVPLFFERKGGTHVKAAANFTARFRQPNDAIQENGTYGDEGKAAGLLHDRRLCCLSERCSQYKIIKIKFAISMIAVTPATESTKASLASW